MIRFLGLISLICGVLIVGVSQLTESRIRVNQDTILRDSLAQLMPGMTKQVIYEIEPNGGLAISSGQETTRQRLFAGYNAAGKLLGVVIEAKERGYADTITAMYAYNPNTKTVTGFSVVEMRETPGLGSKINTDPDFLANFKALDTTHPIEAVKHGAKQNPWQIDAISGATISSRAVGRMLASSVAATTPIIARHRERIERAN
jgi:Na+-translocating ferredoxin:NAD+ oxidoreductase subunit G